MPRVHSRSRGPLLGLMAGWMLIGRATRSAEICCTMTIVTVTNDSNRNNHIQHDSTNNQSGIKVEVMMLPVYKGMLVPFEWCLSSSTQVQ